MKPEAARETEIKRLTGKQGSSSSFQQKMSTYSLISNENGDSALKLEDQITNDKLKELQDIFEVSHFLQGSDPILYPGGVLGPVPVVPAGAKFNLVIGLHCITRSNV